MQKRKSNFELLRIIATLFVVAHHYIVNSGILELYNYQDVSFNMFFSQLWGWGGKTAINVFVLISAFFMCEKVLTMHRILKIYLEIKFYTIVIYVLLLVAGYENFTVSRLIRVLFNVVYTINNSFTGSFVAFYLLIPFLNVIIQGFSKKMHRDIILYLIFIYTGISTFSYANNTFSYIGWYVTLYFIGSYIRLYPNKYFEEKKYSFAIGGVSISLFLLSVVMIDLVGKKIGITDAYYFVSDSHKVLALTTSVSLLLMFKNLNIPYNKWINYISSLTFGIYLIHTRGDAMRMLLWKRLLNNVGAYQKWWFPIHAIGSTFGVFTFCGLLAIV